MPERLTLAGNPALIRPQAPCVVIDTDRALDRPPVGTRVTVIAVDVAPADTSWGVKQGDLWALVAWPTSLGRGAVKSIPVAWLALDLEVDVGRFIARTWLEDQGWMCGTDIGPGTHWLQRAFSSGETRERWPNHVYLGDGSYAVADTPTAPGGHFLVVPALGDLDPDDSTRLDDDSRRVDAVALKVICEQVHASRA